MPLDELLTEIRACTVCAAHLPLGPRPVVRAAKTARLMIIGQAPGTKVHETGIPWNDRSGDRLRDWLQIDQETFYDESKIAIMPMGFCYPGVVGQNAGKGTGSLTPPSLPAGNARDGGSKKAGKKQSPGDAPPRPECAPLWHHRLLAELPNIELTLLVGQYAQKYYLGKSRGKTLTETVSRFPEYLPDGYLPLPHPSWRTTGWQRKNPWFDDELLPILQRMIKDML